MKPVRLVAATERRRRTWRSISGWFDAALDADEQRRGTRGRRRSRRRWRASPSPTPSPARRRAGCAASAPESDERPEPVDLGVRDRRRGRDQPMGGERRRQRDQVDPEQPLQVDVVDDHAAERQADAAADAEDRADHRQPARDLVARERVAHDPEREREDAARDALQQAAGDHDADRGGERVDHRAGAEEHEHRGEHAALAVEVAELADDRRRDRGADQEAGEHPRHRRGAGVELLGQAGSAGTTSVCESENAMQASASVSRTGVGRRSGTARAYVASAPGALELVEEAPISSSIVRRNTASSAWPASGRASWIASASSSQRCSDGERPEDVVHEELDELAATARASGGSTLAIRSSAWLSFDAALDDLFGGGQQRRARDLERPVAERAEHAELLGLARAACAGPRRRGRAAWPARRRSRTPASRAARRRRAAGPGRARPGPSSRRLMPPSLSPSDCRRRISCRRSTCSGP